jgi:Zn-dependent protease with chaperone function
VCTINTYLLNWTFALMLWDPETPFSSTFSRYPNFFVGFSVSIVLASMLCTWWNIGRFKNPQNLVKGSRRSLDSTCSSHRQFENVVGEMAISAGIKMPALYIMETLININALGSGNSENSVVVASPIAVEDLSRDELQSLVAGVIGGIVRNESSVDAWIAGGLAGPKIVFYTALGLSGIILGATSGGFLALLLLPFLIVGMLTLALGRWATSLITKQRRLMSDVSAIQFTRYPKALLDLMDRFDGPHWDKVDQDIRHLFFAEIVSGNVDAWIPIFPTWKDRRENLSRYVFPESPV